MLIDILGFIAIVIVIYYIISKIKDDEEKAFIEKCLRKEETY